MEKIISFLKNQFYVGAVAGVAFIVAIIDSLSNDASSFTELGIVGKIATWIFMIAFSILFTRMFMIPIISKIISWFK